MNRNSIVNLFNVNSIVYSSIIQVGDVQKADPYLRALAIQKEGAVYYDDQYPFSDYPIFTRPFLEIQDSIPMSQTHINHHPNIFVHSINIIDATGSSVIQLGSLSEYDGKARIKHIRILADENDNTNTIEKKT